jgi:hypothetical protein
MGDLVGSGEAKTAYFLTADDLRQLSCHAFGGGIGCGAPRHFYREAELRAAAVRKHGEAGFLKKLEARAQRESKKRQREDDAESALAALERAVQPPPPNALLDGRAANNAPVIAARNSDDAAPRPAAAAPAETAALRKSLLKLAKQALGFRDSGAPKPWRVEVPGVQPGAFAALAGRPADVALRTFVKAGAYLSHEVEAKELFRCAQADLLRVFKREGVGIEIDSSVTLKYKPSDMTLTLHGAGEIICDSRTMGSAPRHIFEIGF